MITRWQEIAKRTAKVLKLPQEVVEAAVLDMAHKTVAHLSHPTLMETDCLGIGALETRFGKLQDRIDVLNRIIKIKKMYIDRYTDFGTPEALVKKAKLLDDTEIIKQDILRFEEFLRLKQEMYEGGGRTKWVKKLLTDNGLKTSDLRVKFKTVRLSNVTIGPGRKKGSLDRSPRFRKGDPDKPVRPRKRRAKRRRGWKPPEQEA